MKTIVCDQCGGNIGEHAKQGIRERFRLSTKDGNIYIYVEINAAVYGEGKPADVCRDCIIKALAATDPSGIVQVTLQEVNP